VGVASRDDKGAGLICSFEAQAFETRKDLERRAGIEPANTGFADRRVSHFATGAHF
jgi:hypothetical protein